MSNWQLPETFIAQYRAACKLAAIDDKAFANFRNDPHIACVIENTTKEHADRMMVAMDYNELLMDEMREIYTPTQIRYHYIAHLIHKLFPTNNFMEFAEIGPGYGGLIEVMHDRSEMQQFHLFDLPEPVALQQKYLGQCAASECLWPYVHWHEASAFTGLAHLCISWCAWSELSRELREEYAEKVISKCDHFFICSNYNKQEDLEILSKYFTGIKEYDDELVQNVIYV